MSEQRTVIRASTGAETPLSEALKAEPEENKVLRNQKKARLVRIRERGIVADHLHVDLPPTLYGQWVRNDRVSIYEMELLGFQVDTEYAKVRALHDSADDTAIIGDTIFMTCDMETKEILDEISREAFEKQHGKPGQLNPRQSEEAQFLASTSQLGMPTIDESRARVARKEHIEAALQRKP